MALQIRVLPLERISYIIPKIVTVLWARVGATAETWTLRERVDTPDVPSWCMPANEDYVRSWCTSANVEMFRFELHNQDGTTTALVRAACTDAIADIVDELELWLSTWLRIPDTSLEIQRGDTCWRATALSNASVERRHALDDDIEPTNVAATLPAEHVYPLVPCEPSCSAPSSVLELRLRKRDTTTTVSVSRHMWLAHPTFRGDAPVFTNARGSVYAGNGDVYLRTQLEMVTAVYGCPYAIVLMRAPINALASRFEATKLLAEWMCVNDAAFPAIVQSARSADWVQLFCAMIPDVCARFTLVDHADLLPLVPRGLLASIVPGHVDLFVQRFFIRDWIVKHQDAAFEPMLVPPRSMLHFVWKQYGAATPAFVRAKNHWIIDDLVVMDEELALKMGNFPSTLAEMMHIL